MQHNIYSCIWEGESVDDGWPCQGSGGFFQQ
jgi:hypothetical protein